MWKKIWYILGEKERRWLPLLIIEIIIGAILETIGISAILPIVNILVEPDMIENNGMIAQFYRLGNFVSINQFVVTLMWILVFFYLFKNVYMFIMNYHQYYFINKGQMTLTNRLITNYFSQPYLYFTKRNIADIQRNVSGDVGKCYQTVLSMIMIITQGCIVGMLILFLLITDWITAVIILGMVFVIMLLFMKITHSIVFHYGLKARIYGAKVIQWINQSVGGIKEVILFNREQYFKKKINDAYNVAIVAETRTNVFSIIPTLMMETICIVSIIFACIVRVKMGGDLTNFVTILVAFALAAIRLIPAIGNISSRINMLTFNKASIDGLYEELISLETKERIIENGGLKEPYKVKMKFSNRIDVKNLSFRYDGTDKNVLDHVSMTILRGESVAFIGPSGAGKTTLADLILGILEPDSGKVEVDGVSISTDIHGWYNQIGYIPQSIYLMDDSIRNNIAFGLPEEKIDDEKIWDALHKAQLENFVRGLPEGLDTNLGDRGIRCSGGQRQRIGIARALYDDPEFLILDEATSALDNDTEGAIMEAINGLKGKKTLLIIAHRLSTTKNCDVIYRIDKRKVSKEVRC